MFAVLGLLAADKLEELFPARNNRPTESNDETQPKFIQHNQKPRLLAISVVDRNPNPDRT